MCVYRVVLKEIEGKAKDRMKTPLEHKKDVHFKSRTAA